MKNKKKKLYTQQGMHLRKQAQVAFVFCYFEKWTNHRAATQKIAKYKTQVDKYIWI